MYVVLVVVLVVVAVVLVVVIVVVVVVNRLWQNLSRRVAANAYNSFILCIPSGTHGTFWSTQGLASALFQIRVGNMKMHRDIN